MQFLEIQWNQYLQKVSDFFPADKSAGIIEHVIVWQRKGAEYEYELDAKHIWKKNHWSFPTV